MGICSSCDATSVATAKLVLHDGSLQEFSYPVKVSNLLQKHPTIFICNADEMEFDDVVSPVSEQETLQLGQLYFALPLNRLRKPLQPEEMAALAVKATSALANKTDKCGCSSKSSSKNVYFSTPVISGGYGGNNNNGHVKNSGRVSDVGSVGSRSSGRRRNFNVMLSAIPE
uniref:uncharacterized protein LOC122605546 n=1 Tax=Erigeron canadensis TaxID=72917 RepID=UPI001CB93044|nr:uncharacterized protein LOC122605546 [Erigeron canadensis]